jgi:transposase InsO family protein
MGLDALALAGGLDASPENRATGDGHRLASPGLAPVLDLEVAQSAGPAMLDIEVRELIARMSRDNPLWGTERIRGELLKLAIVVSNRSIRRYRWRGPTRERSQGWRTFLRNQINGIWAADLFVVQTIGFQTLYVFFFIRHERRELIQCKVTASPTAAWIWRQTIEATAWGRQPQHLIRDRDNSYGADFGSKLASVGIKDHKTPYRAPLANSVAERVVWAFRQECLDHVIVLNERHLLTLLTEFLGYYNRDRPHRALDLQTPVPSRPKSHGVIGSRAIRGGLHHAYGRAA